MNAMLYVRGRPLDFDIWEARGATGWGWGDVLPYFLKAENNERGRLGVPRHRRSDERGRPALAAHAEHQVPCRRRGRRHPADRRLQRTRSRTACPCSRSLQRGGRRWSTADGYLRPAMGRDNLKVVTGAQALGLEFEGGRATGRSLRPPRRGASVATARARGDPRGRGDRLAAAAAPLRHRPRRTTSREMGVPVRHELRGVGENLQDHPFITCLFELGDEDTLYGADQPKPMAEWVLRRSGPLTSTAAEVVAFVRTRAGLPAADIQFHIGALYYEDHGAAEFEGHCATIAPVLVSPRSRGRVWLRSADPRDKPRILTNSLAERDDVDSLVAGMRLAREIAGQEPLAATVGRELQPGRRRRERRGAGGGAAPPGRADLPPGGHLRDRRRRDLGGRPRAAGARPRGAAGGGRVGDAADHRRQHPRADGDDRRARRRPDPRPADARSSAAPLAEAGA